MSFFYVIVLIIILTILSRSIIVLEQFERGVRFRLGRYLDVVGPGLIFIIPAMDIIEVIDMRIKTIDVPWQTVITRDNVMIGIDAIIYYVPVNPESLILQVKEFEYATTRLAQTTVRSIVGDMDFDNVQSEREKINEQLKDRLDDVVEKWGVRLLMVEIAEVKPLRGDIVVAMVKQVAAERIRKALILEGEGTKVALTLNGEAERETAKLTADGDAKAMVNLADGEARALRTVAREAARSITGAAMTLWQMGMLEEVGSSKGSTLFMPYNVTELTSKAFKGIEGEKILG